MDDVSDGDKSAYNSAVQFMFELSGIRRQLHQARWDLNLNLRYDVLISYYMALSARMSDKMKEKHDEMYKKAEWAINTRNKHIKRKRPVPLEVYNIFDEWEMLLRKDENVLGLLVPDKSNPAFALGGQNF